MSIDQTVQNVYSDASPATWCIAEVDKRKLQVVGSGQGLDTFAEYLDPTKVQWGLLKVFRNL